MLDNCKYNKIKLLHELSRITWFLEKHAIPDSNKSGDNCIRLFEDIKKSLNSHINCLEKEVKGS